MGGGPIDAETILSPSGPPDPGSEDLTLTNNDLARVGEREAVVRPLPSEFGSGSSVFVPW